MVLVYSSGGFGNTLLFKFAKLPCRTAVHGPCLFWWGAKEHSVVKAAKLQCKTAGHGPCLFWWG